MIKQTTLSNFGPIEALTWNKLGPINLVIGRNGSGKTFILKALYTALRTLETYQRGDDRRTASDVLADKLYWTFQADSVGELVRKGSDGGLSFMMNFDDRDFRFSFGEKTTKQISSLENHIPTPRTSNSIFLPAKEVLSLYNIILTSRDRDQSFGFDDTYVDLARALLQAPQRGKNYAEFSQSRQQLEDLLGGKVDFDESGKKWTFKNARNQKFPIHTTAEGIKKIAILDRLLCNRYLDTNSVIFIDEPESALHPVAIAKLLDIVALLAERGIQFFIASHSYFVVKKLYLIAQEKQLSIPMVACEDSAWKTANLKAGMPDNSIIDEAIALYKDEVNLALQ
jgi:AAA15 family ATPase/GTPase